MKIKAANINYTFRFQLINTLSFNWCVLIKLTFSPFAHFVFIHRSRPRRSSTFAENLIQLFLLLLPFLGIINFFQTHFKWIWTMHDFRFALTALSKLTKTRNTKVLSLKSSENLSISAISVKWNNETTGAILTLVTSVLSIISSETCARKGASEGWGST